MAWIRWPLFARAEPPSSGNGAIRRFLVGDGCALTIKRGDLPAESVDAIVNAANEEMLGGGGVDGAIHDAAGPALLGACRLVPECELGVRCPTGEARLTPGFLLPARYVIHTVGPVYRRGSESARLLRRCYSSCFAIANLHAIGSIAFPAISCGVYGYPMNEAAEIAIDEIGTSHGAVRDIRIVLFDLPAYQTWTQRAQTFARAM